MNVLSANRLVIHHPISLIKKQIYFNPDQMVLDSPLRKRSWLYVMTMAEKYRDRGFSIQYDKLWNTRQEALDELGEQMRITRSFDELDERVESLFAWKPEMSKVLGFKLLLNEDRAN